MEKYATKQLREQINKFIEQQQNVPFTMANIYRVIDIVIQTNGNRMNTALLEAFDLICSFSAENSTVGEKWKTNANYMVNRKFIVNWICNGYDTAYEGTCSWSMRKKRVGKPTVEFDHYHLEQMEDITKALCFITGRNYDWIEPLGSHSKKEQWGEWFQWGFFRCKGFKKGTMHFEFLDEDVWMKFNQKVASLRGWQLPKKSEKSEERKTA